MMAGGAELKQLSQELQNLASDPDVAQVARELAADDAAASSPPRRYGPRTCRRAQRRAAQPAALGDAGHDAREDPA